MGVAIGLKSMKVVALSALDIDFYTLQKRAHGRMGGCSTICRLSASDCSPGWPSAVNDSKLCAGIGENARWSPSMLQGDACDGAGVTYANAGNCYNCPLHQKVCASWLTVSHLASSHLLPTRHNAGVDVGVRSRIWWAHWMIMEWLLDQNLADLAAEGMPAVLRCLIGLQPDHQNGIILLFYPPDLSL